MSKEDLLGINIDSRSPQEVSSTYQIQVPNAKEMSDKKIKPDIIAEPTDYQEFNSQNAQTVEMHTHDGVNSQPISWQFIRGFLNVSNIVATIVPSFIQQQIQVFSSGNDSKLYIYDTLAKVWRYTFLQTINYITTQLLLPFTAAGDYGWSVQGTNIVVNRSMNGDEVYTPDGALAFYSDIIAGNRRLNFDNQKEVILEMPYYPQSIASGIKTSIGLWGDTASIPAQITSRSQSGLGIRFVHEEGNLYAITTNTATYTESLITGIVVTPFTQLILKFIWKPAENKVLFYVNDTLQVTHTTDVPSTTNVAYYSFAGVSATVVDFYMRDPQFSIEV